DHPPAIAQPAANAATSAPPARRIKGRARLPRGQAPTRPATLAGAPGSMSTPRRPARTPLRAERLETRVVPAGGLEPFDQTPLGALPAGWSQSSSDGTHTFAVSDTRALSSPRALTSNSALSTRGALAWQPQAQPADARVAAAVYLDSLIPGGVFLR